MRGIEDLPKRFEVMPPEVQLIKTYLSEHV
jgi:hypothetical protein